MDGERASCRRCGGLSRFGARFCSACGSPLRAEPVAGPGNRRTVTVLFTDLVGRPLLDERLDAEVVRRLLREWWHAVRAVVQEHGGVVEKYAGDAVMAVFGVPTAREDDALRAASAALALDAATRDVACKALQLADVPLGLRTAVNTGEVLAGAEGGSEERLVVGEPVVVAARLEQCAGVGEVLLGPVTADLLRDVAEVGPPRHLVLRGREGVVPAVPLRALSPVRSRARRTPLLGRDHEQALLEATLDRALAGRTGHLVTVLGEAGTGKTRLVQEVLERRRGLVEVRTARTRAFGAGSAWSPLGDLAATIVESLVTDGVRGDAAGAADEQQHAVLSGLLGAAPVPAGEEVAWVLARLLRELAERRPQVVVLEDLHGATPRLLQVLQDLVRRLQDSPVVVLALASPSLLEVVPGWGSSSRHVVSMTLSPLRDDACRALVTSLLAPGRAEPAVVEALVGAGCGNPLFLEQVVEDLVDSGRLVAVDGDWRLAEGVSLELPAGVAALLAARLDRLPPEERQVLERAAVIGEDVPVPVLSELCDPGVRDELDTHLGALAARDLLVGAGPQRVFTSGPVREAAYAGLARAERARLHELAGALVARRDRDAGDDVAGGHLERAALHLRALGSARAAAVGAQAAVLLARAGTRALTGDAAVAAGLLERAARLLDPCDPRRLALVPDLARIRALAGALAEAESMLREALESAVVLGDEVAEVHLRTALLELLRSTRPEAAALQLPALLERGVPALERAGDDRGLSLLWQLQASALQYEVRWAAMEEPLDRALHHARRAGDRRLVELAQSLLVGSLFHGPTPVPELLPRLATMAEAPGGSPSHRASVRARIAGALAMQGDVDEARALLREVRTTFLDLGRGLSAAATAFIAGPVELLADRPDAAARVLADAARDLARMGDRAYTSTLQALVAEALWRAGDRAGAAQALQQCRATAAEDDAISQLRWRSVHAKLLAAEGNGDAALALADEAVDRIERTDELASQGDVLAGRAEVRQLLGDGDGAQDDLRLAAQRYARKGSTQALRQLGRRVVLADVVPVQQAVSSARL